MSGYVQACLGVSKDLGIFDAFVDPASSAEVAERLNFAPGVMHTILRKFEQEPIRVGNSKHPG